jgi:hypothetical protein
VVGWIDRSGIDLDAEARKAVQSYLGEPAALAQGSIVAVIQGVIAVFIAPLRSRRSHWTARRERLT